MIEQKEFSLRAQERGYHLITREVVSAIGPLPKTGIFNLYIKHTSAAITINENADASVRVDFEQIFNRIVPENMPFVKHDIEGPDDMPAHIKSAMVGNSVCIPIKSGRLLLGTWQGIYLCEFRNRPHQRKLVATIYS